MTLKHELYERKQTQNYNLYNSIAEGSKQPKLTNGGRSQDSGSFGKGETD